MMNLNEIIITDIVDVLTVLSNKGRHETMTDRKCFGLSFTADGQITYIHNGKSFISDRNHAVILPKGQSYSISGNKKGRFPVINFESSNFFVDTITVLPIENVDLIMREFEQMKNLQLLESNRLSVMSLFYKILNILAHNEKFTPNSLVPAIKYLENNYYHNITNAELAHECKISEEHFRKLFKKTYGISPKQYIINMRINKAKQLLTEGGLKMNAISEQSGFSNQYHFCRFFKQKTGLTPTEYLLQNRIFKI